MKLIISNAPRTKKNHGYVASLRDGRSFHMPSKAWTHWCKTAGIMCIGLDALGCEWMYGHDGQPVYPDEVLNCAAVFYRDARRGDLVGYMNGLADLLEHRHIVTNDNQICGWDGTRMELDRANPRTEIELSEVGV